MNPLRFLLFLALPLLALAASNLNNYMTPEEFKHVHDDPEVTHFVTFDVTIYKSETDFEHLGKLKFALFGEHLPVTVANFLTKTEQSTYGYPKSLLHRVVKNTIIQGGYLWRAGYQDYTPVQYEKFPCENFDVLHNKAGRISLANTGGNTNGASFFISTGASTPFFDGKYVSFGQLINGFDVMNKINEVQLNGETPVHEVVITEADYTDLSVPMVMDFRTVTAEYSYFIYFCVAVVVLLVLYRVKGRRSLVDLKSFKL
ncbi:hypothetical protein JCM33374_g1771 [Metschnikowia sp. JCM 33374]|nr:hypothetical protein JCM33374_g1771 [Metschnikowia sp. JCM 33374]